MINKNQKRSPYVQSRISTEEETTLRIFEIIAQNARISQKKIVEKTGLSASLVHSFMSRVIGKGLVRAQQVNSKRWLYFLTPTGFYEKSKLSMEYLSRMLGTYRWTQSNIDRVFAMCEERGWWQVALAGENELSEIVLINMNERQAFSVAGVFSDTQVGETIAGHTVLPYERLHTEKWDGILVCDPGVYSWANGRGIEFFPERSISVVDQMMERGM